MLNAGLEMNMKQEGFGRETLSNIVNNLYNVTNMQRTQQAIEAETPRVNIPGIGMVTTKQAVDLAQYNPKAQSLLEAWQGEHPGEPIESFLLAQDKPWMEWNAAGRPGTFQQWKRDLKATIQISPEERAKGSEIGRAKGNFLTPDFKAEVISDLSNFEKSGWKGFNGIEAKEGTPEYEKEYRKRIFDEMSARIGTTYPEAVFDKDPKTGQYGWINPDGTVVGWWSK